MGAYIMPGVSRSTPSSHAFTHNFESCNVQVRRVSFQCAIFSFSSDFPYMKFLFLKLEEILCLVNWLQDTSLSCDFILSACRTGFRFGHGEVLDGMLKDGLWDVYSDVPMGICAETCAENHNVSREAQVFLPIPLL